MRQGTPGLVRTSRLFFSAAFCLYAAQTAAVPAPTASVATPPVARPAPVAAIAPAKPTSFAPTAIAAPAITTERSSLVELRLQNRRVSLGFILGDDGRILTTLAPLGRGVGITARYADGGVAKLRVLHAERGWDLALLAPEEVRSTQGLLASKVDPFQEGGALRLLRLEPRGTLSRIALPTPHRENLTGTDSVLLAQALTFGTALTAADLGAPIVDAGGAVVAMVAQACSPAVVERCAPLFYAVPTSELRRFLREGLTAQTTALPWLGLTVSPETRGAVIATRIQQISPRSPASTLGLRAGKQGDLLLAVDSTPVGSPRDLAELLRRRRTGDQVTLLLLAEGRYREVRVTLGTYPPSARPSSGTPLAPPDLGY